MKIAQIIIIILLLSSCGGVVLEIGESEKGRELLKELQKRDSSEYANQLTALATVYLSTDGTREFELPLVQQAYLIGLYDKILLNNNVLLNKKIKPSFHIIKDPIPFCFSVPGGKLFISSGLISRYLDHELILVAILAYEMVRMHKDVYKKNIVIPVGHISLDRMLSLTRLPPKLKHEVGKFTYYTMIRSGFDALGYLMWLQLQNKNVLDFKLQLGESRGVAMEEFLFKQFIIKKGVGPKNQRYDTNSSPKFYSFLRYMKRRGVI